MEILEVNQKTCSKCGICAAICPQALINFRDNTYPKPSPDTEKWCITCGHCISVCPTGSLTHRDMPVEQCPTIQKDLRIDAAQCEHVFRGRRSIRVYKKKPVPRDIIVRLIEIARYAPTGHNSQTVEWLVVDNRDVLRRFAKIGADWMRWTIKNRPKSWELPSLIPHLERMLQRQEGGENEFLRDAPAIVIAHAKKDDVFAPQSCAIALTYFDLIAYTMGLGCCWLGAFSDAATSYPPMIEALALPEGHQPFGSIAVGYSKFSYRRLPLRKYPPITWHA